MAAAVMPARTYPPPFRPLRILTTIGKSIPIPAHIRAEIGTKTSVNKKASKNRRMIDPANANTPAKMLLTRTIGTYYVRGPVIAMVA
jgi:hypothetical protein